jgi:glycosyltransferase involved in cell wall biosynthesis
MGKILFDCTPFLVNKTAVHRMVRDISLYYEVRKDHYGFRFGLEAFSTFSISESSARRTLKQFFFGISRPKLLLSLSTLAIFLSRLISVFRRRNTVYFDPIYALFHFDLDDSVVVVHDLTPVTVPEWHSPNVSRLYAESYKRLAASSCTIISDSESTTRDLRVNYGISPSRIHTLGFYLPEFAKAANCILEEKVERVLENKFVLFVGSMEKRKNGHRLAQAFLESGLSEHGYHLVFAGGRAIGTEELEELTQGSSHIHLLGYVSDAALDSLYERAVAFAYVSCWEGFGVPLLEALSRGVPCLAPTSGASPEVGRDAVIYVDPMDINSIKVALLEIVNLSREEREKMVRRGLAIASEYSFEAYIQRFDQVVTRAFRLKG